MEENKLYRVVRQSMYALCILDLEEPGGYRHLANLQEYTPPPPLELEQLEEKVKSSENDIIVGTGEFAKANGFIAYGPLVISMIQNAVREQWLVIKPLISLMLQAKDEKIKDWKDQYQDSASRLLDAIPPAYQKEIAYAMSLELKISSLQAQLQQKEKEIAELKKEIGK